MADDEFRVTLDRVLELTVVLGADMDAVVATLHRLVGEAGTS